LLLGSWLVGSAVTALQYWEFSVRRTEGEVLVERGLFERSTRTVPYRRVQAVRQKEGLLRQMMGRVTVAIDVAGIGVTGEGGSPTDESGPTVLHPLVRAADAPSFTGMMVPGHEPPELVRLPRAALSRYVFRAVAVPAIVAAVLTYLVPFGWIGVVLPVVAGVWGVWAYRDARWGLGSEVLALRWRDVGRTTVLVRRRRIQSVAVSQHPLQKGAGLASLSVHVAASPSNATFEMVHLPEEDAMRILAWVSGRGPGGAGDVSGHAPPALADPPPDVWHATFE
ncbi:MAG TPA: PH domain-containing protein, partial [Coriobacteriia bacterium]|nr:PH domain-containing protein [Coriobacteriia bacterium]